MTTPTSIQLTAAAAELAETLLSTAHTETDGSLTWRRGFDIHFEPAADSGLFNGRIGEALLFAALAEATGEARYADTADLISRPLRMRLRNGVDIESLARSIGLGLTGVGSIIYALTRMAKHLNSETIMAEARGAAHAISDAMLTLDTHFDFYWGLPALLLGLLAVADAGDEVALERARACGARLLKVRTFDSESGMRVWPTLDGVPSTGFAHGNSGVACALFELHRRTKDPEWYDAAIEAIRFESTIYKENVNDWPDVRGQENPQMTSWCHGAPGIILARLSAIDQIQEHHEEQITQDLRNAIHRTLGMPHEGVYTLCCGILGRADCLYQAGLRLSNESLVEVSRTIVLRSLREAKVRGGFLTSRADAVHQSGGMWQGVTGVAYELLRFSDPVAFPSVLTFS